MPFLTLDELNNNVLRLLVYGPPGVGKTHLLGTALECPEMLPMVWFECDGGIVTIRDALRAHWKQVKVMKLQEQADIDWMLKTIDLAVTTTRIRTIAVDSITELYTVLLNLKLAQQGRAGQTPQFQDYGAVASWLLNFLRKMASANHVNLLVTASEKFLQDEMSGETRIYPDITGQMATRAPRFFHVVGYLTADVRASSDGRIREANRMMWVQPHNKVYAKDRTPGGLLGAAVHDPTIRVLYDAINTVPVEEDRAPQLASPSDDDKEEETIDKAQESTSQAVAEIAANVNNEEAE